MFLKPQKYNIYANKLFSCLLNAKTLVFDFLSQWFMIKAHYHIAL